MTSVWNWALGLRAPCRRALTAAAANCSTVAPRSSIWMTAHAALRAMSTDPEGFSSSSCMRMRSARGTPSSMPARVAARSPVHIFSTPTASTVPVPPSVARTARWSAEDPPAHELSTLTMPALRRPAWRRNDWPRMQPWSTQPAGGGVAEDHQVDVGRVDVGVGQGVGHHLVGHVLGRRSRRFMGVMAVPTMCALRPWCPRYPRRAGTPAAGRAATRRSNWSNGWSAVTYTATCSAPAPRKAATTSATSAAVPLTRWRSKALAGMP